MSRTASRNSVWRSLTAALVIAAGLTGGGQPGAAPPSGDPATGIVDGLPLAFEPNHGQAETGVLFRARAAGYEVRVGTDAVELVSRHAGDPAVAPAGSAGGNGPDSGDGRETLRLVFEDADPQASPAGLGLLPGRANYIRGRDPAGWVTGVPTFDGLYDPGLYPGIDLAVRGSRTRQELIFVVTAEGDPLDIGLGLEGAARIETDEAGNLVIGTGHKVWSLERPVAFQEIDGTRRDIPAAFRPQGDDRYGIDPEDWNPDSPLYLQVGLESVRDPGAVPARELADGPVLAVDPDGNAFIAGRIPPSGTGPGDRTGGMFVAGLDPSRTGVLFTTIIGTGGDDLPLAVAVAADGNLVVAGRTNSSDFPVAGAIDDRLDGPSDGFVLKLETDGGGLVFSTLFGGSGDDAIRGVAFEPGGDLWIAGATGSADLPVTSDAWQVWSGGGSDAFLARLADDGSALRYAGYVGGGGDDGANGIAVDAEGHVYLAGGTGSADFPLVRPLQPVPGDPAGVVHGDAFVVKMEPDGSFPVYSTLLGGSGDDAATGIAADGGGNAYVVGRTTSADFPVSDEAVQMMPGGGEALDRPGNGRGVETGDAFVTRIDPGGDGLVYSTFLGGSGDDAGSGITVSDGGDAWVTGTTASADFPTEKAEQKRLRGGMDAFAARIAPEGDRLVRSTYVGGDADDTGTGIALGRDRRLLVAGVTRSVGPEPGRTVEDSPDGGEAFIATASIGADQVISWVNAAGGNWNLASNWSPAQVPTATDDVDITLDGTYTVTLDVSPTVASLVLGGASGTQTLSIPPSRILTLDGASSVNANGEVDLSGGQIAGAGGLTLAGPLNWTAGSMSGAGTVTANGAVNISGTGNKDVLNGRDLETNGTTTWTGTGNVRIGNGAVITNGGTWVVENDQTLDATSSAPYTFNNNGTYRKQTGTGTTTIDVTFNNDSTVEIQTGTVNFTRASADSGSFSTLASATLQFGGGTHDLNPGASVSGAGTFRVTSGTVNFNAGSSYVMTGLAELTNGTLNFSSGGPVSIADLAESAGTLTGTDTVTVTGTLNWTAGTMSGAGSTIATGPVDLTGTAAKDIAGRTLQTTATTTWTGTGLVRVGNGGIIHNTGTWVVENDALLDTVFSPPYTFNNDGTFRKQTGTGTTTVDVTFNNSAMVDVQSGTVNFTRGGSATGGYGGLGAGTLQFGGGTHDMNSGAMVSGPLTVRVTGGTVNFNAGSGYAVTGPTELSNGTLNFSSGNPVSVGDLTQSNGTLTGTDTVTVSGTLGWMAGTMSGAGTTIANGPVNLSGTGSKDVAERTLETVATTTWTGTGQVRIGNGGVIDNTGTWVVENDAFLDQVFSAPYTFNNNGTFRKQTGTGTTTVDVTFNNNDSVEVKSGTVRFTRGGTATGDFVGPIGGTLEFGGNTFDLGSTSSVGIPEVVFSSGTVNLDGSFDVGTKTWVTGGTANLNPGSLVTSVGDLEITSGTIDFSSGSGIAVSDLTQSNGNLSGADTVTVSGTMEWTGGDQAGAGTTIANGPVNLSGTATKDVVERTLQTTAATTWTDSGQIRIGNGGVILNTGTWTVENDVFLDAAFSPPYTFNNNGTFRKQTGTGTTTVDVVFNNDGTVDVQSGRVFLTRGGTDTGGFGGMVTGILEFGAGTHELDSGASIAGLLTLRVSGGTVNFNAGSSYAVTGPTELTNGTLNFSSGNPVPVTDLTQSAGTLTGTDTVTVSGTLDWTGGDQAGAGTTIAIGPVNLSGAGLKDVLERTLQTTATTSWTGAGQVRIGNAGVIDNTGTWVVENDTSLAAVFSAPYTFNNNGTFRKQTAAGVTAVNVDFNNDGTVDIQSGTVNFSRGSVSTGGFGGQAAGTLQFGVGTHELDPGASVAGPLAVRVSGATVNFNAGSSFTVTGPTELTIGTLNFSSGNPVSVADLTQSGGTITGTDTVTVSGTLDWTAGIMSGAGTTIANGAVNLSGIQSKDVLERTLQTAAATTWTGTGYVRIGNGGVIDNTGTWSVENDTTLDGVFSTPYTFNNSGTFRKQTGAGTTTVDVQFSNSGLVQLDTGLLNLSAGGGFLQTAGLTLLDGGQMQSVNLIDIQGGDFQGIGTVTGSLSSGGQFIPGLSPGTLTLGGSYVQTGTGAYIVELGGTTPGSGYDQTNLTAGTATFSGDLQVGLINSFVPVLGDNFVLMTYPSRTGVFSSKTLPPLGGGLQWGLTYGATSLILSVGEVMEADLTLSMSDSPDPVLAGEDVVYTLTIGNNGPSDATTVVLADTLPAGVIFVSAVPSQGSCLESAGIVTCDLGDVLSGAGATVIITVTTTVDELISNTAAVSANEEDPVPATGTAAETTLVKPACADLDGDTYALCDASCIAVAGTVCGDCDDGDIAISPAAMEVCDGIDNDCNHSVDDGLGTIPELCNGEDDNCNGLVDEGNPEGGASCSTGLPGVCDPGTEVCENGGLTCLGDTGPGPELCDGIDNDCDGAIDNVADSDGDGIDNCSDNCPGAVNPPEDCDSMPGTPDEQCDADNDGQGDVCDCAPDDPTNAAPGMIGDTVDVTEVTGLTTLGWDPVAGAANYNIYRGYRNQGTTFVYNHECIDNLVPGTTADDMLNPRTLTVFYYLITTTCDGTQDSTFGTDWEGNLRPQPFTCPPSAVDGDGDGVQDASDNCPAFQNGAQSDYDADSHGDVCDNCPLDSNPSQADLDGDGLGDTCDPDRDGDGVLNGVDNCPDTPNPPSDCDGDPGTPDEQCDSDMDGIGDACDPA